MTNAPRIPKLIPIAYKEVGISLNIRAPKIVYTKLIRFVMAYTGPPSPINRALAKNTEPIMLIILADTDSTTSQNSYIPY